MTYTYNTVFTKYAITKLNNTLLQNYESFNFSKIKIANKTGILDYGRTSLVNIVYTLPIDSITINDNIISIIATIPETVEGINIKEIGVYDTISGIDNLFTLTEVDTTKPSNLPYKLLLTLDISLRVVNLYPIYPDIEVVDYDHVTLTDKNNLDYTLNYITTNLERIVQKNAVEIGYNKAQVFYKKEESLKYYMDNLLNTSKYSKIVNAVGESHILECYYHVENNYLYHNVRDLVNSSSYLKINNNLMTSHLGHTSFSSSGGTTLFTRVNLDELSNGLIFGKLDSRTSENYFSFKVVDNYLQFTLYSPTGYFIASYDILNGEERILSNTYNNFFVTFNNNFISPEVNMYINNIKVTLYKAISNFDSLSPTSYLPLVNYEYSNTGEIIVNDKFTINNIMVFSKVLSDEEIFIINTINI